MTGTAPGRRLLITRPADDAAGLVHRLAAHGIAGLVAPMLTIRFLAGPPLDLAGVQALAATSANGVRAFVHRQGAGGWPEDLPVFAVGDATQRAALALGFRRTESAAGDVAALAALIASRLDPAAGEILHGAASDVAGDLAGRLAAAGFVCRREVLYAALPAQQLDAATADALAAGTLDGVMLFSPRTARTLVRLIAAAGLADAAAGLTAWCLSRQVAEEVRALSWRSIAIAAAPTEAALLARVLAAEP